MPIDINMKATECEYFRWFRLNADFGPADGDVKDALNQDFIEETGKDLPEGWDYNSCGEKMKDLFP